MVKTDLSWFPVKLPVSASWLAFRCHPQSQKCCQTYIDQENWHRWTSVSEGKGKAKKKYNTTNLGPPSNSSQTYPNKLHMALFNYLSNCFECFAMSQARPVIQSMSKPYLGWPNPFLGFWLAPQKVITSRRGHIKISKHVQKMPHRQGSNLRRIAVWSWSRAALAKSAPVNQASRLNLMFCNLVFTVSAPKSNLDKVDQS